ncbi:hypothetical protein BGZ80_011578 [Entomortierella chlamydospora]|uniref:F-box domain-containing protein n=1 Tax=Entomortierella chlamydospora TaxID=101097 RepID=A0A9P6N2B4_9FUNG|nr:hypothetical protein BGZ80_011578 [Entomortierella chlamydospora]
MTSIHPLNIPEILDVILNCESILKPDDLQVTSLVCRSWAQISRRALWRDLELTSESWIDPYYEALFTQLRKHGSFLRYLRLPHVSSTSGGTNVMLRICDSAYGIQHLELMDSEIDDGALTFIAEACPKLKSLDLSRNEAVTFSEIIKDHQIAHGYDHAGMKNGMESMPISKSTMKEMDLVPTATSPAQYEGAPYSVYAVTKQRDIFNREYSSNGQQLLYQNQQPNQAQLQARLTSFCCHDAEPDHCISSERRPLPKPNLLQMQKPFMYLEELSLVFCLGITNNEFQALFWSFRDKNLRSLNLQFTNIEDSGLETLARALTLPLSAKSKSKSGSYTGLKSINVSYCSRITARGIKALVEGCPQLLDLDFLCCDQVSAECFRGPLPWACVSLRSLEFTFHPRVLFTKGRWRGEVSETIEQTDGIDGSLVQVLDEDQDSAQDIPHVEQSRQKQSEEHEDRVEDKPSHEKESVRDDYFAMFRQLRRLSQLRSLHIYNSPGLNSSVNSLDSAETWIEQGSGSVGMAEPSHVYEFVPDAPLSSQINTSPMQEDTMGDEGSSSSSSSTAHTITDLTYRSNHESDSRELRLTLLASEDEVSNSTNSIQQFKSCRVSESSPVSLGSDPLDNLTGPITLHPFSHKMGFKALGRLKNLRTLTLYERSSITLGQSEVRWIGNMFPQLSLLQLRGAIETSDDAIKQLKTRRPKIQVQVCSLFEN